MNAQEAFLAFLKTTDQKCLVLLDPHDDYSFYPDYFYKLNVTSLINIVRKFTPLMYSKYFIVKCSSSIISYNLTGKKKIRYNFIKRYRRKKNNDEP